MGQHSTTSNAPGSRRWWPINEPGDRAEIGSSRDQAWAQIVSGLASGLALAVDYGHLRDERASGASFRPAHSPATETVAQVLPAPDGSCDITAHVAMDACRARRCVSGVLRSPRFSHQADVSAGARPRRQATPPRPGAQRPAGVRRTPLTRFARRRAARPCVPWLVLVVAAGKGLPAEGRRYRLVLSQGVKPLAQRL